MGNTVGVVRMMLQNLPEDTEIIIEDAQGNQLEPYQCGIARKVKKGNRAKSFVFDGTEEETNLETYHTARFMFKCHP